MWYKEYRDYKIDEPLIQEKIEPGQGIIGCEMHELNGWGEGLDQPMKRRKRGFIGTFLVSLFSWFGAANSQKEEV